MAFGTFGTAANQIKRATNTMGTMFGQQPQQWTTPTQAPKPTGGVLGGVTSAARSASNLPATPTGLASNVATAAGTMGAPMTTADKVAAAAGGAGAQPPAAPAGGGSSFVGDLFSGARDSISTAMDSARATGAQREAATGGYGTESGPGILEQWFNQRANGTDPAYEYGMRRGMDSIDNRMAAGGSFNSGARGQQLSDFAANMAAQRMGQLDSLAGGASGEHRDRVNSMFAQGMGLAGGQAGLAGQYDIGASNAMSAANQAILAMMLNKAGVDSRATQGFINNLFSGFGLMAGGR